mgnify:CR=1 FL=1|tara:strand:+ start:183 stop:1127 length:945 start_codon:yes stop_codon:yes gene_type:complete
MNKYFDFEKSIENLDIRIKELEKDKDNDQKNLTLIEKIKKEKKVLLEKIYKSLTSWQKVQIARHVDRPHTLDYINKIFTSFISLAGDKKFSEDEAIVGGLAKIDSLSVIVIGNEKGKTMETRIKHNFGMAKPEGYRKVQRLMLLAEKLQIPIITLIDTAGAFPGKEAEERGQSESIASTISKSLRVKTPIISVIIGEGGSGGAIALATADRVMMLENSIYSVISPEGCASILWRTKDAVQKAADALKLTAEECLKLKIIDKIIKEPLGGAHRFAEDQIELVKIAINEQIEELIKSPIEILVTERNEKFLNITTT